MLWRVVKKQFLDGLDGALCNETLLCSGNTCMPHGFVKSDFKEFHDEISRSGENTYNTSAGKAMRA